MKIPQKRRKKVKNKHLMETSESSTGIDINKIKQKRKIMFNRLKSSMEIFPQSFGSLIFLFFQYLFAPFHLYAHCNISEMIELIKGHNSQ